MHDINVCRYRPVDVCIVHVSTDGNLSGNCLCKIWQTSIGSTLLQCNDIHCCCSSCHCFGSNLNVIALIIVVVVASQKFHVIDNKGQYIVCVSYRIDQIDSRLVCSMQHALPLPFFLLFARDIYHHIQLFNSSGIYCLLLGVSA